MSTLQSSCSTTASVERRRRWYCLHRTYLATADEDTDNPMKSLILMPIVDLVFLMMRSNLIGETRFSFIW